VVCAKRTAPNSPSRASFFPPPHTSKDMTSTHTHTSGERASGSAPAVPSSLLCVGPALLLLLIDVLKSESRPAITAMAIERAVKDSTCNTLHASPGEHPREEVWLACTAQDCTAVVWDCQMYVQHAVQ
jgi:hypothetical protein